MTTRTMGLASGWRWLLNAVNLGAGNPRAIFGGAALVAVVVFVVAIVLSIVIGLLTAGGGTGQVVASTLLSLPLLVLMGALLVGYLRVIDAVEHGRPAGATGVFGGFGDSTAWMRAVAVLVVLALLQYVLIGGLVALIAPETGRWYIESMAATPGAVPAEQMALPPGFGRAFAVVAVVGVLLYAAQGIALGQVALRGRGVGAALADGLGGALRNALPLALLMLLSMLALLVIGVVVVVLAMLVAALGSAGGTGLLIALGVVIGIPLYALFLVAMLVVSCGVMYFIWRDVCDAGDGDAGDDRQVAA